MWAEKPSPILLSVIFLQSISIIKPQAVRNMEKEQNLLIVIFK